MSSLRTQIYLTREQRRRLDQRSRRDRRPMAALIRDAVDVYLGTEGTDASEALRRTFGVSPNFTVPDRDEWTRG